MITAIKNGSSVDLTGKQGTTWIFHINVWADADKTIAYDLTDFNARGAVKTAYKEPDLLALTCSITDSTVTVSVLPAASTALTTLTGIYDIEIYNADESIVERIQEGSLTVSQEVTI